ncbi:hypothetical protein C4K39_0108 [Pseudomonas sessilinigenes]|nr:hypothetical protein C4K39_0108 [Pseudomonas sessilinigenes]
MTSKPASLEEHDQLPGPDTLYSMSGQQPAPSPGTAADVILSRFFLP